MLHQISSPMSGLSAVMCLGLLAVSQAPAQQAPYKAVVSVEEVMVRSGAGRAYYEVGELERGTEVTVESELFNWYKIRPPKGVYSFVDRKNVDIKGSASRGVVNTDRTVVTAAHASRGPGDSYRNQGDLNEGDVVEIVDTVDYAYKIVSPATAFVFLPPGSLRVADETDAQPVVAAATQDEAMPPVEAREAETEAEAAQPAAGAGELETDAAEDRPAITPTPIELNPPVLPDSAAQGEQTRPETDAAAGATEVETNAAPAMILDPGTDATTQALADDVAQTTAFVDPMKPFGVERIERGDEVVLRSTAGNRKLRAVEAAMLPYFQLPVEDQPIARMVRGYATAAQLEGLSDSDLLIIQDRLTTLQRNRALADALAQGENQASTLSAAPDALAENDEQPTPEPLPLPAPAESASASGAAPEAAPETAPPDEADGPPVETPLETPAYDAVGILTASSVHTGGNQPRLLRLINPTARRTIAYVEPGGPVDIVQMLGRLVGITGRVRYDPTTKLNLIDVRTIDILSAR